MYRSVSSSILVHFLLFFSFSFPIFFFSLLFARGVRYQLASATRTEGNVRVQSQKDTAGHITSLQISKY